MHSKFEIYKQSYKSYKSYTSILLHEPCAAYNYIRIERSSVVSASDTNFHEAWLYHTEDAEQP